jgi:hypothetical protein
MQKVTPEIKEAAERAASYLSDLVGEYGGSITRKTTEDRHARAAIILALHLERHPCPPHRFGWSGSAPMDAYSQAILTINLAALVHRELAAHVGNPDDPENCQCYECFRQRLAKW